MAPEYEEGSGGARLKVPSSAVSKASQEAIDEFRSSTTRHTVLVDLNIILDVLQLREPHYSTSAKVWAAAENGHLRCFVAAHSVTTLFYLFCRSLARSVAAETIRELLEVFSVAKVDERVLRDALSYGWKDYEDAVQMAAAVGVGASYLITRNPKDFAGGAIAVLQPSEVPAILQTPH